MRGRPKVLDHDAVLNKWAAGMPLRTIAKQLGLRSAETASTIVQRARRQNDPRAHMRHGSECIRVQFQLWNKSEFAKSLMRESAKRGITNSQLVRLIAEIVLQDDMLKAVLDD